MAFIVKFLPKIIFSFSSAFFVDRFNKQKIMAISEIISCIAVGLLAFNTNSSIIVIYVFYFIMNASIAMFDPTRMAIIPTLFKDKKDYAKATSELTIIRYATMLIATGIGGYFFELFGAKVLFIFDACTFFVSALIILSMKLDVMESDHSSKSLGQVVKNMWDDVKEGMVVVKNTPIIKNIITIFSFRQFVYGIGNVVFSLLVLDKLLKSEFWLGLAYTAGGVGCVLGGFAIKRYLKKIELNVASFPYLNIIVNGLNAIIFTCMFLSNNIYLFLLCVLLHDITMITAEVTLDTSIITFAEEKLVGRMSSFYMTMGQLVFLLGTVSYIVILKSLSYDHLGILLGCIMFAGPVMCSIMFKKYIKQEGYVEKA